MEVNKPKQKRTVISILSIGNIIFHCQSVNVSAMDNSKISLMVFYKKKPEQIVEEGQFAERPDIL
jgi:hypothetical protein